MPGDVRVRGTRSAARTAPATLRTRADRSLRCAPLLLIPLVSSESTGRLARVLARLLSGAAPRSRGRGRRRSPRQHGGTAIPAHASQSNALRVIACHSSRTVVTIRCDALAVVPGSRSIRPVTSTLSIAAQRFGLLPADCERASTGSTSIHRSDGGRRCSDAGRQVRRTSRDGSRLVSDTIRIAQPDRNASQHGTDGV